MMATLIGDARYLLGEQVLAAQRAVITGPGVEPDENYMDHGLA